MIYRPRRSLAIPMALLLVAGASSLMSAPQDAGAPLRNEDVVRMVARGGSIEDVLGVIQRAAAVQFELDPEMLIELRRAGVPERVLAAMIARQRELAPASPPPPIAVSPAAVQQGTIELVFQKDPSGEPRKGTAVTLENDAKNRRVELSFFVICLDPMHVPDQWHTKTPLKAPFPRHEMLWFHQDTQRGKPSRREPTVFLALPDRESLNLAAGSHSLLFGVAARSEGSEWTPLATVPASLEVKPSAATKIVLLVRTARVQPFDPALGPTPWITCEVVRTGS